MRTYAYILTLQWRATGGLVSRTITGTADLPEGMTRHAATRRLFGDTKAALGVQDAVLVFFSLEPDEL
jgi:hypothetical protein